MKKLINLVILFLISHSTCGYCTTESNQTIINSDKLIINYENDTASFYGNVKVTKKNTVLYCKKIIVYSNKLNPDTTINQATQDIKKIEFFNNIQIEDGNTIAKGDIGEYNSTENTIILLNNVSLKENENYLEGDKLIYNLDTKIAKIISLNQTNNNLQILQKERVRAYIPDN